MDKDKKNISEGKPKTDPTTTNVDEPDKIVEDTINEIMAEISELQSKEADGESDDADKSGEDDHKHSEEIKEDAVESFEELAEESEKNSENAAEQPQRRPEGDQQDDSQDAAERDDTGSDAISDIEPDDHPKRAARRKKREDADRKLQEELDKLDELDELDDAQEIADMALKKHRTKKKAIIISCSILGLLIAAYLGTVFYFSSHFYPYTEINGTGQSMQTVAEVESYFTEHVAGYELSLEQVNGSTEVISGSDISLSYEESDELKGLLDQQNPFLWPAAFFHKPELETAVGVSYDEAQLEEQINALACMSEENQTQSISAYPKYDGNEFVIEPEVIGTDINTDVFKEKVAEHVSGLFTTLNMEEQECYVKPQYVSDSQEVLDAAAKMNEYLQAVITYEVSPQTEVVDKTRISEWVTANEAMEVTFNEEAVKEFVSELASKYNTIGTTRTMTTANGNSVEVSGGDYGWRINQDEEYTTLVGNITAGETVSREPVYSQRGADHGEDNDYGNTYAEVDLSSQYMWFIQDGTVVLESGIVTGNPNKGYATPQGSYTLTYKTRNAVLKGALRADGTREYETPVSFWMPFNGGIGFHDATWQSSFGGSRYLSNGSHGCVNLPYSVAEQLYSLIQDDTPIILHY